MKILDGDSYYVEERMALRPWMFQGTDKIYSAYIKII